MGRFYTLEGMHCDPFRIVYVCVRRVMGCGSDGDVMHVGDDEGVHHKIKNNKNFGLRTLLVHKGK